MKRVKRSWDSDEKLKVLKEAEMFGVLNTLRKYNIYATTFYKWKKTFDDGGVNALKSKTKQIDAELKKLTKENAKLRRILDDKELEIEIKNSLIKAGHVRRNEKVEVINEFLDAGHPIGRVLRLVGLSKSSFYYAPKEKRPGRQSSTFSKTRDGGTIQDSELIEKMKGVVSGTSEHFGYIRMSNYLKSEGIIINKKKVYRLMSENGLIKREA